jgi:hypothetical protein
LGFLHAVNSTYLEKQSTFIFILYRAGQSATIVAFYRYTLWPEKLFSCINNYPNILFLNKISLQMNKGSTQLNYLFYHFSSNYPFSCISMQLFPFCPLATESG